MVICCVPKCGADSWRCDGSITFYDFPSNPELAAKWIKQINTALKVKPMWFPRGKPVICSKHFLHTDFKGDTDSLNPRSIPTVFGHKYIGPNPESNETNKSNESKTTPLIVKVVKPRDVIENDNSQLRISDVRSEINDNASNSINDGESLPEIIEIREQNLQIVSHDRNEDNLQASSSGIKEGNLHVFSRGSISKNSSHSPIDTNALCSKTNDKKNELVTPQQKNYPSGVNGIKFNHVSTENSNRKSNPILKKIIKKKGKSNSELIEIGPNTFLKINPDIIKVNKKQTPSGNTVLQFLMDQKLAKTYSSDVLPRLIQGVTSSEQENDPDLTIVEESNENTNNNDAVSNNQKETVQHVLGHVVDNSACEETQEDGDIVMEDFEDNNNTPMNKDTQNKANTSFIEKAPVLLTTNMPLSHCFIDKPKYVLQLKQKSRQIASLKVKMSSLNKKIEDLEDRCIVQERQLSYSFIKRLKSIRKNAAKGDPRATYILEQIRSYSYTNNSKMRWSDTTLSQCAIWCRKAPYAYEYFRKADFFKMPCLGSVKRFIKKNPDVKFQNKVTPQGGGGDDDESSDFDFEESDGQYGTNEMSEDENVEPVRCETVLSVPSEMEGVEASEDKTKNDANERNEISKAAESIANHSADPSTQKTVEEGSNVEKAPNNSEHIESSGVPVTVDSSNLELQEIVLPSGEVVQCYSSTISNSADIGGQYYIIPNVGEQHGSGDHEYSVIQADSLPVVLQNLETSQLHLQQDQLIFIANSSGQVECCETEVTSV